MSDTEIEALGPARVSDGPAPGSGGRNREEDGTLGVIPAGDDELAWAEYRFPELNQERPVALEIEVQGVIPAGDDELAYWIVLSDYSGRRWETRGPFIADRSPNPPLLSLILNSETIRPRYVSLLRGPNPEDQPGFSVGIITQGIAASGTPDPERNSDEFPRLRIHKLNLTVRDVAQTDYFATRPYYTSFSNVGGGIEGGTSGQPVDLTFPHPGDPVAGGKNEANTYEIARQELASGGVVAATADLSSWAIGSVTLAGGETSVTYSDPTDNDTPTDAPLPGHTYRYFIRGISAAGESSNWSRLGSDLHLPLVASISTGDGPNDFPGTYSSIAMVNGRPAIAYFEKNSVSEYLKFVWANDARGERWGTAVDVDMDIGTEGGYVNLMVADGMPVIAYHGVNTPGQPRELMFVRADDEDGFMWQTPISLASDSINDVGMFASLRIVDGHPAVSYLDGANNSQLAYIRAESADGVSSSWSTPVHPDTAGHTGYHTSLQVVAGNPAIAYLDNANGDIKYVRAADAIGASWGTPVLVDDRSAMGQTSLAIVAGRPAISYVVSGDTVTYSRSSDPLGIAWGTRANVFSNTVYSLNGKTNLFVWKDVPTIVHTGTPNGFQLRFAQDAGGSTWGSSLDPPDVYIDSGSGKGQSSSFTFLPGGEPIFSYYAGNQRELKYANPFEMQ